MRATWLLRGSLLFLLAMTVTLAWPAAPAQAGPWDTYGCGCGGYGGGYGPVLGGRRGTCGPHGYRSSRYARSQFYDCLHQRRFMAHGSGWYLLRRYLHRIHFQPTHFHPRRFWYRRWPSRLAQAETTEILGHTCCGHDQPFNECKLAMAALGTDDVPAVATARLAAADRLLRGMERFHRGVHEDALEDFRGAVAADPDDARAHMGILMCALMDKDWQGVASGIKTLHRLGELDGADRLDLESCFSDQERFTKVREGLAEMTRYHFHKVDAQLAAAWAWVQTGELERARGHLKGAMRFDSQNAIAKRLLETMDSAKPEPAGEPDSSMQTEEARPRPPWQDRPVPNLAAMQE